MDHLIDDSDRLKPCPFCGSDTLRFRRGVPRCKRCRAVFLVDFSRYMRRERTLR